MQRVLPFIRSANDKTQYRIFTNAQAIFEYLVNCERLARLMMWRGKWNAAAIIMRDIERDFHGRRH
jgi:hypothetical protein